MTDGLIARVEVGVEPESGDEQHETAVPGLPNVHSHTFQRAMAGLTEYRNGPAGDDFWTWRDLMYRFVARLDPDDVEAIAALAFAEMLETGFTRVGEFHYLHHDPSGLRYANPAELAVRIVAASATTGIGLTLLPAFYAHSNFGGLPPTDDQKRFVTDRDEFARLLEASRETVFKQPGGVLGVAPHSLRAATPGELQEVVRLALPGSPIHIHVAEQTKEVDDCLACYGQRPVEWLLDTARLDARWCLIHATHTTPEELAGVASRGSTIGLCPVTEANLGDGLFDARSLLGVGGQFGIGSDSNILIDAAGELRQLEYSQRLMVRGRSVLTANGNSSVGRTLFEAALRGGSQALGVPGAGLSEGQPADVVSLTPIASATSGDRLLDGWVFASRVAPVESVWCRGRLKVARGRHVERDVLETRYRAVLSKCLSDG